eukprot:1918740-Rhodomonas_salina.1
MIALYIMTQPSCVCNLGPGLKLCQCQCPPAGDGPLVSPQGFKLGLLVCLVFVFDFAAYTVSKRAARACSLYTANSNTRNRMPVTQSPRFSGFR